MNLDDLQREYPLIVVCSKSVPEEASTMTNKSVHASEGENDMHFAWRTEAQHEWTPDGDLKKNGER